MYQGFLTLSEFLFKQSKTIKLNYKMKCAGENYDFFIVGVGLDPVII